MEILKEDTKCLRCGQKIKRSKQIIDQRKRFFKTFAYGISIIAFTFLVLVIVFFLMVETDVMNYCTLHRLDCHALLK